MFHHRLLPAIAVCFLISCTNNKTRKQAPEDNRIGTTSDNATALLPHWALQSNIYEVNVRQYTKEGTFNAFSAALPRLKDMGVQILWFMPITPISVTDRKGRLGSYYAVQNYTAVNPEFGNLQDWKNLVSKAHQMGFKVITDWVPNHTGADNGWLVRHPDFYTKGKDGKPVPAFDWTDTRDLNYDNHELRDSMIAAMKFWIKESDIDGFRCDVAGEVPDDFWKACIGSLKKEKDVFMLAEGDKGSLHRDGFNITYGWDMFATMKRVAAGERNALSIDSVLMRQDSSFPAGAVKMYFTSNHDENSWNKADYGTMPGAEHAPFAVFTQTMRNSIPLVYSGQEEPVMDSISFFYKNPIAFGKYKRAAFYKTLLLLRAATPALAVDASFKKVHAGDDKYLYAFVREKDGHKVGVILNLSDKQQTVVVSDTALAGNPQEVFTGAHEQLGSGHSFTLPPWAYKVYNYDVKP